MPQRYPVRKSNAHGGLELALTEKQALFIDHLVSKACNQTEAARLAGYATPRESGYKLMQLPHIQLAVRQARARLFGADLANIAADTLKAVMQDTEAPASARVSAARTVLEVTRELGRRKDDDQADKDLSEMTPDEMAALIDRWQGERASIAKEVAGTVVQDDTAQDTAQDSASMPVSAGRDSA